MFLRGLLKGYVIDAYFLIKRERSKNPVGDDYDDDD